MLFAATAKASADFRRLFYAIAAAAAVRDDRGDDNFFIYFLHSHNFPRSWIIDLTEFRTVTFCHKKARQLMNSFLWILNFKFQNDKHPIPIRFIRIHILYIFLPFCLDSNLYIETNFPNFVIFPKIFCFENFGYKNKHSKTRSQQTEQQTMHGH